MKYHKFLYTIIIVFFLYIYIFNPRPLGVTSIIVLYPIGVWALFSKQCRALSRGMRWLCGYLVIIMLFSCLRFIIGGDIVMTKSSIAQVIDLYFVPIGLSFFIVKYCFEKDIYNYIFYTVALAAFITFFLVLNPSIAYGVRAIFNVDSSYADDFFVARREFGISQYLRFTYSILMGYFAGKFLTSGGGIKFCLGLICIVAVAFNARTGFAALFVSFFFYFFKNYNLKSLKYLILLPLIIAPTVTFIASQYPETYEWLNEGFIDVFYHDQAEKSTRETLQNVFYLPNDLATWIVGSGYSLYYKEVNGSDIGYTNQLFYGGLLYFVILVVMFYKIVKYYYKLTGDKAGFFSFVIILMISNYKGYALSCNELSRYLVICICILYFSKVRKRLHA